MKLLNEEDLMNEINKELPDSLYVEIYGEPKKIKVLKAKVIGQDSSVRVYQAEVALDEERIKTVLIKELKAKIDDSEEKFREDFERDKKLFQLLGDDMAKPLFLSDFEDRLLALYQITSARSLDDFKSLDIFRVVEVMENLAKILKKLHDQDISYMDLEPSNILYDYQRKKIQIFD